ncbi:hypothetical protein Y032_0100g3271 [Ancylostoma ceylanicum]|uniref:Uncharacterized protein n=1 Tax=Ancylostoma ceylanicum TaxID=53326 RepID=A0A016TI89_9BILA|nr:hypothetical protein Y032_0100g3271 [Ancylostoma ceylanicum]
MFEYSQIPKSSNIRKFDRVAIFEYSKIRGLWIIRKFEYSKIKGPKIRIFEMLVFRSSVVIELELHAIAEGAFQLKSLTNLSF